MGCLPYQLVSRISSINSMKRVTSKPHPLEMAIRQLHRFLLRWDTEKKHTHTHQKCTTFQYVSICFDQLLKTTVDQILSPDI